MNRSMRAIQALAEALDEETDSSSAILENMLNVGETTYVIVSPGIQANMFAQAIAYAVARGGDFHPYGLAERCRVLYCASSRKKSLAINRFRLLAAKATELGQAAVSGDDIAILYRHCDGKRTWYLDSYSEREKFLELMPKGNGLVVIDNFDSWVSSEKSAVLTGEGAIDQLAEEINSRGISALIFLTGNAKAVAQARRLGCNIVVLTEDSGAPIEYGGGFTVERFKQDENEAVPTRFQWWYTVVEGKLDYGWVIRDFTDAKSAKRVEVEERRMRIEEMLAMGMEQKDIALAVQRDPATVSRDVAAIKARNREGMLSPKPAEINVESELASDQSAHEQKNESQWPFLRGGDNKVNSNGSSKGAKGPKPVGTWPFVIGQQNC